MPWFTPAQSFAEGWNPGPQLQAAPIHGVLSEILQQRNYERALMQKNIADTIKNVQGEMQANKYLESLKGAKLVPQDYEAGGVGGATYGTSLAKQIQDRKEADALTAYRNATLGISQGHLDVARQRTQMAQDYASLPTETGHALGETWYNDQGDKLVMTTRGPKLVAVGMQPSTVRTTAPRSEQQTTTEQQKLEALQAELEDQAAQEKQWNIGRGKKGQLTPEELKSGVPFSRSLEYAQTKKRLEEIKQARTAPPPADQNLARGYGLPAQQPNKPVTQGEQIDPATVQQYIQQAGGDRDKAREMARADGWTF